MRKSLKQPAIAAVHKAKIVLGTLLVAAIINLAGRQVSGSTERGGTPGLSRSYNTGTETGCCKGSKGSRAAKRPIETNSTARAMPPAGPLMTAVSNWPVAPQSPSTLAQSRNASGLLYEPHLFFYEASAAPPPEPFDLLTSLTTNKVLRGRLLYIEHTGRLFFVLRGVNRGPAIIGQSSDVASYRVQAYATVFEPEFSVDGERILFKIGDPYSATGRFNLFLWDMAEDKVRPVSREFITPSLNLADPASSKLIIANTFGQANSAHPTALYGEDISFRKTYWSPNSRWIAYVRSGDRAGWERRGMQPLQLRILDVNSGRSQRIVRNPGVVSDMAWTTQNTLLFVMLPQEKALSHEKERNVDKPAGPEPDAPPVTSIFESAPGKGAKPNLLIANAEQPLPSPDNGWIAFLRPQADKNDPSQELCVFNRQSGAVTSLVKQKVSFMLWTPDSRQLVVVKALYHGAENNGARGEGIISLINVGNGIQRDVTTLAAHDYRAIAGSLKAAQFEAIKVSRDGQLLFVRVTEATGPGRAGKAASRKSLVAVNLTNGNTTTVAQFDDPSGGILGLDWHDETGTAITNISPITIRAKNTQATPKKSATKKP